MPRSLSSAGHGKGKGRVHIEVPPADEVAVGVPDNRPPVTSALADRLRAEVAAKSAELAAAKERRGPGGQVDTDVARLMGAVGGAQRALNYELTRLERDRLVELTALAKDLLPGMTATDPMFEAGLPMALEFIEREAADLSRDVGGGECPNGPMSMVTSAGLQLLASRVEFARGNFKTASALANDSRQNLLSAQDITAKRALARHAAAGAGLAAKLRRIRPGQGNGNAPSNSE